MLRHWKCWLPGWVSGTSGLRVALGLCNGLGTKRKGIEISITVMVVAVKNKDA